MVLVCDGLNQTISHLTRLAGERTRLDARVYTHPDFLRQLGASDWRTKNSTDIGIPDPDRGLEPEDDLSNSV